MNDTEQASIVNQRISTVESRLDVRDHLDATTETANRITRTTIAAHTNKLNEIISGTTALTTDMTGLKNKVAGLKTDVADLKTEVADVKADVAAVKTDVADLKTAQAEHGRILRAIAAHLGLPN